MGNVSSRQRRRRRRRSPRCDPARSAARYPARYPAGFTGREPARETKRHFARNPSGFWGRRPTQHTTRHRPRNPARRPTGLPSRRPSRNPARFAHRWKGKPTAENRDEQRATGNSPRHTERRRHSLLFGASRRPGIGERERRCPEACVRPCGAERHPVQPSGANGSRRDGRVRESGSRNGRQRGAEGCDG